MCVNSCKLFKNVETECSFCGERRYKQNSIVPTNKLKMISIGDHLSRLLSNNDERSKMRYRSSREAIEGVYSDYFDGADYKEFREKNIFQNPDDVAIVLYE